jgi:glycosyltransferase involved in cell wall biosynthesis
MLGDAQIAVVVPAYNEVLHIAAVLRAIPWFVDRVIVVDDGSADGTAEAACAVRDARVHVLSHVRNRGVGAALKTGYRAAFDAGADVVAVMAGDGQMHPDDLLALLGPIVRGEADYVKGDRLSHPEARARMPRMRFIGNHLLSALTRVCTSSRVRDSQCGYTALGRSALAHLPLASVWEGYGYPNDMLGWLFANRAQVRDIVVRPIYGLERSGIGLRHALFVIPFVLARIVLRRIGLVRGAVPTYDEARAGAAFGSLALEHNPDSN